MGVNTPEIPGYLRFWISSEVHDSADFAQRRSETKGIDADAWSIRVNGPHEGRNVGIKVTCRQSGVDLVRPQICNSRKVRATPRFRLSERGPPTPNFEGARRDPLINRFNAGVQSATRHDHQREHGAFKS